MAVPMRAPAPELEYPRVAVRHDARVLELARPRGALLDRAARMLAPLFQAAVPLAKAEILEKALASDCLIRAAACSAAGNLLAVAKPSNVIDVYGMDPGRPLAAVVKADGQRDIVAIAWSPTQPAVLAVGGIAGLSLWILDMSPSQHHTRIGLGDMPVTALAFSPCGLHLAAVSPAEAAVRVWDLTDCSCQAVHRGRPRFVRWGPVGAPLLVAGMEAFAVLLSPATGLPAHVRTPYPLAAAAWTPDGKAAIVGCIGSGKIYHLSPGPRPAVTEIHDLMPAAPRDVRGVVAVEISHDGEHLAVLCDDGRDTQLWAFRLGRDAQLVDEGKNIVSARGWAPRGIAFAPPAAGPVLCVTWAPGRDEAEMTFVRLGK